MKQCSNLLSGVIGLTLFIIPFILLAESSFAQAQRQINIELTAKKVPSVRGFNPNVIKDIPDSDDSLGKDTSKSRGQVCAIFFHNETEFYINIYVDGFKQGQLSPGSEIKYRSWSGYKNVYAITTGGTYEWNAEGNCKAWYHYWLRRENAKK